MQLASIPVTIQIINNNKIPQIGQKQYFIQLQTKQQYPQQAYTKMGNQQTCCGININADTEQQYELSSKIYTLPENTMPSSNELLSNQTVPLVIELPQLNPDVLEVYQRERPFEDEFNQQQNKYRKKINADIYYGPLDQTDKPTRIGKLYKANGALLISHFVQGIAQGPSFYIMANGSFYKGEMKDNAANCDSNGQFVSNTMNYIGGFKNNLFHGQGEERSPQKDYSFKGKYNNGKKVQGTMKWLENNHQHEYIGSFNQNGQFNGKGKYTDPQGTYSGEFTNGKKHGYGIYHYKSKLRYQGNYVQGKKHGQGQIINFDGTIAYKGTFENGMPHGKGIATSRTGQVFQANWNHGIDIRHLSEQ